MVSQMLFPLGFLEKELPGGTHIIMLYESERDMLDAVNAFAEQGLARNELCILIAVDGAQQRKMEQGLAKLAQFEQARLEGRIILTDHDQVYFQGGVFNPEKAYSRFDELFRLQVERGFSGVRVFGDAAWTKSGQGIVFDDVCSYEEGVTRRYHADDVLAMCAYPIQSLSPTDMVEIIQVHSHILYKKGGQWRLCGTVEREIMGDKIKDLENFTKFAVDRELKMVELKDRIAELEDALKRKS